MDTTQKSYSELVAERLIAQLEAGTAPWQRPWTPGAPNAHIPVNAITGKRYRGLNAIHLLSQGRGDPRWLTYKQAVSVGAQVRRGEKGTRVEYWKYAEERQRLDESGRPVLDAAGQPIMVSTELERPIVFNATVFNASQVDGLPPLAQSKENWQSIERAEKILSASGANIAHVPGDAAFYASRLDTITMPARAQFDTAARYYAVALHELGHWTGHSSRLDRDLAHPFGSEGYAKEELRAEIASMLLGDELGIGHDPGQHAAYVGSWIQALKEDHREIYRAASDAEKIVRFVLALENQQRQTQDFSRDATHSAPAFLDSQGRLRDWESGERIMQKDWQGIAKSVDTDIFFMVEEKSGERTFTALRAGTFDAARDEARDLLQAKRGGKPIMGAITILDSSLLAIQAASIAHRQMVGGELSAEDGATEVQRHLGVRLPKDWTGELRLIGVRAENGKLVEAPPGIDPTEFHLYARGKESDDPFSLVAITRSREDAEAVADKLRLYEAAITDNPLDRAAKLAAAQEVRVRRDSRSTDEDIIAAKEARKTAEAAAFAASAIAASDIERKSEEKLAAADQARRFIDVPFREKDDAKKLGAKWDRKSQRWFIPAGLDAGPFAKWAGTAAARTDASAKATPNPKSGARQYLAVPFPERDAAKAAGARWDKVAKSWFVGPAGDLEILKRWIPDAAKAEQAPAMNPREEFGQALQSAGLVIESSEHPIMDGKGHRVPVIGGKPGSRDGYYIGYLDGCPAGRIVNHRAGSDTKWRSQGYALTPEQKAQLQAETADKQVRRTKELEQMHEASAQRISKQVADLVPIEKPTPYLQSKGIQAHHGVLTDLEGRKTYVPAMDVSGKVWTMQYIQEDGTKRYAKDSRKEGCFHPVGGLAALSAAPVVIISEGYATAAQVATAVGHATVAAFDSGNLLSVAKALRERFPDKPIVIAGDDDRHQELTDGRNPGRQKAEAAAQAVGGRAIFPTFAISEASYPSDLPPITPESYRTHSQAEQRLADASAGKISLADDERDLLAASLLGNKQIAALKSMKSYTDFNDLAKNSLLGPGAVARQVGVEIKKIQDEEKKLRQERQQARALDRPRARGRSR